MLNLTKKHFPALILCMENELEQFHGWYYDESKNKELVELISLWKAFQKTLETRKKKNVNRYLCLECFLMEKKWEKRSD